MSTESAPTTTNGVNLDWAVGCNLELKTTLGEEVSGKLFSFDRITNCLVLSKPGSKPGTITYRFLKANFVKEVCSAEEASESSDPHLPYVDLEESWHREEQAVRAMAMQEAPSVGDIEAGQKAFSKLSKKWKCRWEGRAIVVEEEVTLNPPYRSEDFRAEEDFQGMLEEIRETMEEPPAETSPRS
ncbi:hypothetical protein BSKO_12136 [Bryopsis sp. KO-2023]|nr:hypothetical protein BSKO_12136 [Bryopsis sp. KO-2023]